MPAGHIECGPFSFDHLATPMSASIYLVKGREKSLLRRHPWIFS
ncbi:TPA: 23S rRNA (cytosine(1962)-C(5))-methyltransferase RlmI, partial [Aeromonas hydrophila]|nr:23S rRNA (cytosine(1962)-C(5))-methyltransferase RlmI [Aeromonas hydrophila]